MIDAGRRALSMLLLLCWAAVGIPLAVADADDETARGPSTRTSGDLRRDADVHVSGIAARTSIDDDNARLVSAAILPKRAWADAFSSARRATDVRFDAGGWLAGRPRGPPARA